MAKYSKKAGEEVEKAMRKRKKGKLKSGKSITRVKSKKQAIAIGLSEARKVLRYLGRNHLNQQRHRRSNP